jgi:hypothetical protein
MRKETRRLSSGDDAEPFVAKGFRRREFFPHQVIALRKAYPDSVLQLRMRGVPVEDIETGSFWQLNLYSSWIDDLPEEIFRSKVVNWHQQQLGRRGLIAAAGLFVLGNRVQVSLMQSDLCQQIFREPRLMRVCGARLNNRFRYWYTMLFNAVLDFATDQRLSFIESPTSEQILGTTRKSIDGDLFRRIYDWPAERYDVTKVRNDKLEFWSISVCDNEKKVVRLEESTFCIDLPERIICVCHDIEENVDTPVSAGDCQASLAATLEVEKKLQVRSTYNILGTLFRRKYPLIAAADYHSIAFHTYDHSLDSMDQLPRTREIDLQVKGYRTAKSVITRELSDCALNLHNFEWLMSSAASFGFDTPRLENGIVKIPVHLDDYSLYTGDETYARWRNRVFDLIQERRFVAIGFHDCYSKFWSGGYAALLDEFKRAGEVWTCDQVLHQTYLLAVDSSRRPMK